MRRLKAVVDRIENGIAVLLLGEAGVRLELPLSELPSGTRESSILRLAWELDPQATAHALDQARARIERLRLLSRGHAQDR